MKTYIYRADMLCDSCGEAEKLRLDNHSIADNGDSDNYPQGPYDSRANEADTPQTCGKCDLFLENPLTADGIEYVRTAIAQNPCRLTEWADFYRDCLAVSA